MNKYAPHIYVIPEDDADRQLALGFIRHDKVNELRIKVMTPANGWPNVLRIFETEYIQTLRNYTQAHVVMLIDFDGHFETRKAEFDQAIPDDLEARVGIHKQQTHDEAPHPRQPREAMNVNSKHVASTSVTWGSGA